MEAIGVYLTRISHQGAGWRFSAPAYKRGPVILVRNAG